MPVETMTPKERWKAVLRGDKPDRVPMDFWGTEETVEMMMRHLRCATAWEMYERLRIDKVVAVAPHYCGPPLEPGFDEFGCRFEMKDYGTGSYCECVGNPLARFTSWEEIEEQYTWPTPDWFDYSSIPRQIVGREEYPVKGGGSEPFLRYCQLRGLDQAFIDLALEREMVVHCLDRLFAFCREDTVRTFEQIPGKVDLCYVAEDFGSQERLLMAPDDIRAIFVPRMKKMIDLAHSAGAAAFFHSDGAVREIVPDMIDAGIDILNPIQWRCPGMDRKGLKDDFGGRVVFHGGVDNQETLPFGKREAVREEVLANIEILGRDGGYILAPCHNIQPNTPPENVAALYETGLANGWY